ncbi:MAG: hypothetical protein JJE22_10750 [Bacteroidia bacterium]|nr:hypothetical protein [Bacteroidia bacterium]
MKTSISFLSIICLSFLFACSKSSNQTATNSHSNKVEFKEGSVTIPLKECKNISFGSDQLKLCLDSVSDSRCPSNVICVWSGTAIASLSFTKNGQVYPVTLAIPPFGSYQEKIKVAGYTITLLDVTPYPVAPPYSIPIEPTKAEIKISN